MLERIAAPNERLHLEAEQYIELMTARESGPICPLLLGARPGFPRVKSLSRQPMVQS